MKRPTKITPPLLDHTSKVALQIADQPHPLRHIHHHKENPHITAIKTTSRLTPLGSMSRGPAICTFRSTHSPHPKPALQQTHLIYLLQITREQLKHTNHHAKKFTPTARFSASPQPPTPHSTTAASSPANAVVHAPDHLNPWLTGRTFESHQNLGAPPPTPKPLP